MAEDQENTGWGEQTVNQLARAAISRLVDAEQLDVRIKTSLKQITKGLIEAIAILFQDVLIRENLRVQTLQMEINEIRIKPSSAIRGKIRLVDPATGRLQLVIRESQITTFLNSQFQQNIFKRESSNAMRVQNVSCRLMEGCSLTFDVHWRGLDTEELQLSRLVTIPQVVMQGQSVNLVVQFMEMVPLPAELVTALLTPLQNLLSLEDFSNRGTRFVIQQIDIAEGKVSLSANAFVEQFPTA